MAQKSKVGRNWGYADDIEATAHPITKKEWKLWHHLRQACAMIAFMLDDDITDPDDERYLERGEWW